MASLLQTFRALRSAGPAVSKEFFTCRQCLTKAPPARPWSTAAAPVRRSPFLQAFRANSTRSGAASRQSSTPLGSLGKTIGNEAREAVATDAVASKSSFPETSDKKVAYFLFGSAAAVFGIVVFGGLTRLTESGLSITEWKPVTGSLPPLNTADWEAEFTKYKSSPEFKLLNPHMDVDEFKKIYYMEWTHRIWGRVLGLGVLLPTFYFIARRRVSKPMAFRLLGICGLIGFQGFLGWYMVSSGLKDDLFAPGSHPRVSQYRLTAHLGTAFVCYTAMLWNGLAILRQHRMINDPAAATELIGTLKSSPLKLYRPLVGLLSILIFTTAMSGGLVAGLDAGLIYNEFPKMGLGLTPPKSELWSDFYARDPDGKDLVWRNMLENPSLVQLNHRILATTTTAAILALYAYTRFSPRLSAALPRAAKKGTMGLIHLVGMQVALGISTLIYLVPTPLAAAHQAGSLALLTGAIVLCSRITVPKRTMKMVAERLARGGPRPVQRGPGMMASEKAPLSSTTS
ncbi:MAG: hypothetical protein M1819_001741 [Sarea resinae]|nr:MAG: hypothetical protein M1819_001741 [Sarea resinae]